MAAQLAVARAATPDLAFAYVLAALCADERFHLMMCALSRKGRGVRVYRKLALVAYLFRN